MAENKKKAEKRTVEKRNLQKRLMVIKTKYDVAND